MKLIDVGDYEIPKNGAVIELSNGDKYYIKEFTGEDPPGVFMSIQKIRKHEQDFGGLFVREVQHDWIAIKQKTTEEEIQERAP